MKFWKLLKLLKLALLSPVLLFCAIAWFFSRNKSTIDADMARLGYCSFGGLISLLFQNKEFRNVFYYRIGPLAQFASAFLRENQTLHIMTKEIGRGLIVVHGDSTYINAKRIGDNCYVNQCVTIGVVGTDAPVIGNDVRVATGAIVLGKITIGDHVNIGAGAVVVKNVPDNCTVVGNPARIIKKDGQRVDLKL